MPEEPSLMDRFATSSQRNDEMSEDEYEDEFENEPQSECASERYSSLSQKQVTVNRADSAVSSSSSISSTSSSSPPSSSTSILPNAKAESQANAAVNQAASLTTCPSKGSNYVERDNNTGSSPVGEPCAVAHTSSSVANHCAPLPEHQSAADSKSAINNKSDNSSSFASTVSSAPPTTTSQPKRETDSPALRSRPSANALRKKLLGVTPLVAPPPSRQHNGARSAQQQQNERVTNSSLVNDGANDESACISRNNNKGKTNELLTSSPNAPLQAAGDSQQRLIIKHQPHINALTLAQLRSENATLEREWRRYDGEVVDLLFLLAKAAERVTVERTRLKEVRARRAALEQRDRRAAHTIARLTQRVSTVAEDQQQLSTRGYYDQAQMHLKVRETQRQLGETQRGGSVVAERAKELEERVRKKRLARITSKEWARLRQRYSENANQLTQLRGAIGVYRGECVRGAGRGSAATLAPAANTSTTDNNNARWNAHHKNEKERNQATPMLPPLALTRKRVDSLSQPQHHHASRLQNASAKQTPAHAGNADTKKMTRMTPIDKRDGQEDEVRNESSLAQNKHSARTSRTSASQHQEHAAIGGNNVPRDEERVAATQRTAVATVSTLVSEPPRGEATAAEEVPKALAPSSLQLPSLSSSTTDSAANIKASHDPHTTVVAPITQTLGRAENESQQPKIAALAAGGHVAQSASVEQEEEISSVEESAADTTTSGRTTPMWLR